MALARAARDRAIALTKRIERWPDCAGVGATATIISHYPRRGGYRAHAAAADAFDAAHSYEHVMVKGARERQGRTRRSLDSPLRACAELAGVPEEVATTLRTHGIVLEPVESTNAVGEIANGVETVPVQVAIAPEAATARVWVPGVERPIVAPASLPEDALIVPWEPQGRRRPHSPLTLYGLSVGKGRREMALGLTRQRRCSLMRARRTLTRQRRRLFQRW